MVSGTADNPYGINSAEDLKRLAEVVNAGNDFAGKFFVLTADIRLSGNWTPIGYFNSSDDKKPFNGTFDGQGHTIKNLTIENRSINCQGLFGFVGENGTIKNLNLSNVNISGYWFVGGLVGDNWGTVTDCTVSDVSISGDWKIGGLVGYNGGTVENCTVNNATVSGYEYSDDEDIGDEDIGGLVGDNGGTVENCTVSNATVSGTFVVSGTGDMYNYSPNNRPPWHDERDKIKCVFVEKGVTSVGDWAFADCPNLKRVVLSSTVKSLKDHTFENCPSLKLYYSYRDDVRIITGRNDEVPYDNDTVIVIGGTIFVDGTIGTRLPSNVKKIFLLIPDKNIDRKIIKQLTATDSSEPPVIEVDTNLEDFGNSAFANADFQRVKILEGVKSLGKRVFANCTSLTNIKLPDVLEKIGAKAFAGCTALVKIVIPPNVQHVGDNVFSGCSSLKKIFYRAGARISSTNCRQTTARKLSRITDSTCPTA